jgi:hypothetical protein
VSLAAGIGRVVIHHYGRKPRDRWPRAAMISQGEARFYDVVAAGLRRS